MPIWRTESLFFPQDYLHFRQNHRRERTSGSSDKSCAAKYSLSVIGSSERIRTTHLSFVLKRIKSYFSISIGSISMPISTSPLSIRSFTISAVAVKISNVTSGYFSLNSANRSGSTETETISPHPAEILPSICASCSERKLCFRRLGNAFFLYNR